FEQTTWGWAGSAGTILVIDATVARAHEQARFLKPADGAAEMRAVDGKDLELIPLNVPHPAGDVSRFAVPGSCERVPVGRDASVTFRKPIQIAQCNPGPRVLFIGEP